MGRNSRSRQVQKKKKATAAASGGSGPIKETEVSGSLMSMRQGLKKVAGTSGEGASKGKGANMMVGLLIGVVVVAVALMIFR